MEIQLGIYQHYSGKQYRVLGVGRHSETLEELVIYQALYDSDEFGPHAIWARPKKMFGETVEIDGQKVPRFKKIK
ncbi:MAG: DUF1653 domain-containing protein [Patescibacteria group bacterium]